VVHRFHRFAFRGLFARRCDSRARSIDYFDRGVKRIRAENKKTPEDSSGVWFTACMSPPSIGAAQTTKAG
jgi:hypothetical protein